MNQTKIMGAATLIDVMERAAKLVFDTPLVGLSWGERTSLGVAALLLVLAVASPMLLRWTWPELAFEASLRHGERVDPWGKPWVGDLKMGFRMACHSCGPNGIDEDGKGDDIPGIADSVNFGLDPENAAGSLVWALLAWSLAPSRFVGLGVLGLWLVSARRLWSASRGPTTSELVRAVVLGAVPILATWLVALWLRPGSRASVPDPILISPWIATAGSISLGCTSRHSREGTAAFRLLRPSRAELAARRPGSTSPHPSPSPTWFSVLGPVVVWGSWGRGV